MLSRLLATQFKLHAESMLFRAPQITFARIQIHSNLALFVSCRTSAKTMRDRRIMIGGEEASDTSFVLRV